MLSTTSPTQTAGPTMNAAEPGTYRRTVMDRMRERLSATSADQRGFGTLDVLLGMAIAVLILVIGGLNMGKIRDSGEAYRMGAALESYVTDNYTAPTLADGGTPSDPAQHSPNWGTGATVNNMSGLGVSLDSETFIRFYRPVGATVDGTYTFCSVMQRNGKYAYAFYDSRQDKVLRSGIRTTMPTATECT